MIKFVVMNENKFIQGLQLLCDYQDEVISNSDSILELAKSLRKFIDNSKYRPSYDGSLLDIIGGISEPVTSQIIANILILSLLPVTCIFILKQLPNMA